MTKQNMSRLTESQLFTIEALNRIQFFKWPNKATHAAMNRDDTEVLFYVGSAKVYKGRFSGVILLRDKFTLTDRKHPDWRNSLITREQFDSVDGWVRNIERVDPECVKGKLIDVTDGVCANNRIISDDAEWDAYEHESNYFDRWRYHKPSNPEVNETSAITDPAPYFARRSFPWVDCENGFIIPDRVKEVELAISGGPIIEVLAELDTDLQKQGWPKFQSAHIDLKRVICNHTNQNITAHVIRYLPIDAREADDHEV